LEVGVGGEEVILVDTVRHWGGHRLLVVSLMGVRGGVGECDVFGVLCCLFLLFGLGRDMEVVDRAHTGEICITEPLEWGGDWIQVLVRRLTYKTTRANRLNAIKSPIVF